MPFNPGDKVYQVGAGLGQTPVFTVVEDQGEIVKATLTAIEETWWDEDGKELSEPINVHEVTREVFLNASKIALVEE